MTRRAFSFTLAAGLALSSVAWADRTEPRPLERFERAEVSAGIHLVARTADKQSVEVTASEADLPEVVTEVKDGALHIKWRSKPGFNVHHGATVTVAGPSLRGVEASGGAQASVDELAGESIQLSASGGGELEVKRIVGKRLTLGISGGSRARLEGGTLDTAELKASGGASLHAQGLVVHQAQVDGSGGSTLELDVDQKLSASLSGGARATVHGKPQVEQHLSGGAKLLTE